jgi:PleD family two-component response regulator
LMLPATSLENGARAAERIRGAIALCRLRLDGADIQFTISAGVSEATDADDSAALLMRAEAALRSAINSGRNRTVLHNGRRCFPSQFLLAPAAVE